MNLPNKLTVCRILLVPVFIVFAILANQNGVWWQYLVSAVIFAVASFTDFLDGQIAPPAAIWSRTLENLPILWQIKF